MMHRKQLSITGITIKVSFKILAKGVNMGYWGAKHYDPPGSKHTFDKLGDPRIYMFPDQGT